MLESNRSSVLLCFIDDEFFYDIQCRAIWNSFYNEQQNLEPTTVKIVFPALIKNVSPDNFSDERKKMEIYQNADFLGFYNLTQNSNENSQLNELCNDIVNSLSKIGNVPRSGRLELGIKKNVHAICEIDDAFIKKFHECNENYKKPSERIKGIEENTKKLKAFLDKEYADVFEGKEPRDKREYENGTKVCVIYTGGTAGMIMNPDDIESQEFIQANLEQLTRKLPRLTKEPFEIDFYSFAKPLDSSNITCGHWLTLAAIIEILDEKYDGFVIIHGSNTLAYTASSLSFLLDNVRKPIILTGSELALDELNNDAEQNIQRSVEVAAHESWKYSNSGDVCILFGRRLILGNRATKQIALDTTEGFYSPNYPELAPVSHDRVVIDTSFSKVPLAGRKIEMNKNMSSNPKIVICDVYPDMDMKMFQYACEDAEVGAVIIRTYGTGGVPDKSEAFLECLKALKKRHIIVVNLTQCPKGTVEFRFFDTNATLFNLGVISGGDMVTEAAYCKLKHLFAKFESVQGMTQEEKTRII